MRKDITMREYINNLEYNKRLLEVFLSENQEVYIYGAGLYGGYAFDICKALGAKVLGFITTKKEKNTYKGISVFSIDEINSIPNGFCKAILPGFIGCTKNICNLFSAEIEYCEVDVDSFRLIRKALLMESAKADFPYERTEVEEKWDNVLIIRMDAIGDVLCTIPLAREIKRNYPNCKITLLVQNMNCALAEGVPYIDRVLGFDGDRYDLNNENDEGVRRQVKFYSEKELVKYNYDIAILGMHFGIGRNDFLSIYLALASGAKTIMGWATNRDIECAYFNFIGKKNGFDITVVDKPMHEIDYMLQIIKNRGLRVKSSKLLIAKETLEKPSMEGIDKRKTMIAVGLVGSIEKKSWSPNRYSQLFKRMAQENIVFVLLGGADALEAEQKVGTYENVISYINKCSLKESIEIINECDMYLGANTGLMHIAAALDKPCITLYASLKNATPWSGLGPVRWGVRDVPHIDLIPAKGLDGCCYDCQRNFSHCINQISVTEVIRAIERMNKSALKKRSEYMP